MAKMKIPDPMTRRHLIEKDSDAAHDLALAELYLEEGRAPEALAFLVKAGADDRLAAVADQAVAEGDAFLLKQHSDATGTDPGSDRWLALATAAEAAGKERYAEMARRHARSSDE
jgi:hypothetical protein